MELESAFADSSQIEFTMAHMTEDHINYLYKTFGKLNVLDDIIQFRKTDDVQSPILAYPKGEKSVADYEYFTAQELDRLIDGNVKQLIKLGLGPVSYA